MKKVIFLLLTVIVLSSCKRGCQSIKKKYQASDRVYEVVMFSGGDTVFYDRVKTMMNNSEHSDGVYYYKGDTLIEVSGDYVVKSVN